MQTFLPYEDFERSAASLDRLRLGKQRVENLQVMNALVGISGASAQNHPIALAWRGYARELLDYQWAITREWTGRGYADTCWEKTLNAFFESSLPSPNPPVRPPWLGDEGFHRAYRALLIRKDPTYLEVFTDLTALEAFRTPGPWDPTIRGTVR